MQLSDRGVAASERATPPADTLVGALQGLYRAFQKRSMYPSGHPSVPEAIQSAAEKLRNALAGNQSLVIGVAHHLLLHGDERIGESSEQLRALALLLHELDVAAVEFHAGITAPELELLVDELVRARREEIRGPRLVEALARDELRNVRLCPIDYRALSFAEGALGTGEAATNPWEQLSRVLTDPTTYGAGAVLEQLADEVTDRIGMLEGAGVGGLRSELHRQVEAMDGLPEDQRSLMRQRMAAFVNALNPELRRNLLQVSPHRPAESLELMSELADVVPASELIEALQNVNRVDGSAHEELLTLLRKLIRISHSRPAESDEVDEILRRWGVSRESLANPAMFRSALEEMFQRRAQASYNPEDYQALLDGLSQESLSGAYPAVATLYRDPADVEGVRIHAAEIATLLLARPDGDQERPVLFGYVAARTDLLLDHGRWAPIRETAVAARADRLLKADSEPIRRAAEGYLADFGQERRLARIIAGLKRAEQLPDDALYLLELGGARALDLVLDNLSQESGSELDRGFRRFAAERDPKLWAEILPPRCARGWPALEPLFPPLREMASEDAVPLLQRLLEHEAPRTRREALVSLCDISRGATVEPYLVRALGDENAGIVTLALRRLAELETPAALDLLGAYLADNLRPVRPSLAACRLAFELLSERGEAGSQLLCAGLDALCRSVHPRRARLARMLAEHLETRAGEPQLSPALARWRRSPARLVSLLLASVPSRAAGA